MKQVVRKGIKDMIVQDFADPVPMAHQVLIRPIFSLISSGTETASIHQQGVLKEIADNPSHIQKVLNVIKANGPVPTLREVKAKLSELVALGYSGAGIIADKHPTITDLEIGDRVAYGGEGTGHGETIVTGRNLVVRMPRDLSFRHACFGTLGSIALNSVRIASISLGESVAVIGLGLVGQLVAQLARLQGGNVIGIDLRAERLELAAKLGAHEALGVDAGVREAVSAATDGRGVDCVIIAAAAKSSAPAHQALAICRDRGRIVVVGAINMEFPWNDMYLKEVQLLMARAYGPGSYDPAYEKEAHDYPFSYVRWTENRNMQAFLRLAAAGSVQLDPLITHEFALDAAPEAYETILQPGSRSLAVLLKYPAAESSDAVADFKPVHRLDIVPGRKPQHGELGVALIGAGNLARWAHLPALQKAPGAVLRAIHSNNSVRAKSYAARFGAAYCATDFAEVLADPQVHVVLITTRNQDHAAQALAALRAGKHVFVEKPMALTEQECHDLYTAVQQSGKQLTVGFNRRFAPCYVVIKDHLRQRSGPAVLNCRINSPGISGDYWMADPAIGGAVLGEACHFVDLMYWLLDAEPVSVAAYSLPSGKKDPIGENNIAATFRFEDGSVGTLTYCTVGSKSSGGERVEAFTSGMAVESEDFKRLTIKRAIPYRQKRIWPAKGYEAQLQSFFESVRSGKSPAVTVRDGARATICCIRLMQSCKALTHLDIDLDAALAQRTATEVAGS